MLKTLCYNYIVNINKNRLGKALQKQDILSL